jgi:hypothetical protein
MNFKNGKKRRLTMIYYQFRLPREKEEFDMRLFYPQLVQDMPESPAGALFDSVGQ